MIIKAAKESRKAVKKVDISRKLECGRVLLRERYSR
jgi:hypothetical protein